MLGTRWETDVVGSAPAARLAEAVLDDNRVSAGPDVTLGSGVVVHS